MLEVLDREIGLTMPVVLCGDWNCPPQAIEHCLIGNDEQRCGVARRTRLKSAYASRPLHYSAQDFASRWNGSKLGLPGPPPGGWMDVFDYIFYSTSALCVHETWREPAFEDTMVGEIGIPRLEYPSDHVSLACTFAWRGEPAAIV